MRNFKKILALLLSITMVFGLGVATFAADPDVYGTANSHTITITNSDANGNHAYEAYQVFKGNLNADEEKLSDIEWGTGVDSDGILEALIAANAENGNALKGKFATLTTGSAAVADDPDTPEDESKPAVPASTAEDVAKAIAALGDNSAELDAVARIINDNLGTTKATFSGNKTEGYTATVPNDGYYFIKDTTTTLPDGDTASKFMLNVVKDVTINAKDTSMKPDKEITGGTTNVKAGTAAVGDTVTFQVAIQVPDTTNYKQDFWFIMDDTLPEGMTFMEVTSVKTYKAADIDTANGYKVAENATATGTLTTPVQDADAVGYTVTVAEKTDTGYGDYGTYTKPADSAAAVTTAGGQKIKVTFNEFKEFAETKVNGTNHIGEYVVITYTAVVNDDAVYGSTGNKNEVEFTYSNDPNHDYDGDNPPPNSTDPVGQTPKDETETFVAGIEILKVDGSNDNPLANAEFQIASTSYNKTVTKGVKYEKAPYTAGEGETIESGDYWLLKDGSYTNIDPNTEGLNKTQYDNPEETYKKVSWTKIVKDPAGDGANKTLTFITGSDGIIDVKGLKPGTYTITETHAPDGYNKIDDTITIVIDWDAVTDADTGAVTGYSFKLGTGTTEGVTLIADGNSANAIYKIKIENNSGTELPSTGGIGTTIFYIVGGLLAVGAGVVLVSKKRMGKVDD